MSTDFSLGRWKEIWGWLHSDVNILNKTPHTLYVHISFFLPLYHPLFKTFSGTTSQKIKATPLSSVYRLPHPFRFVHPDHLPFPGLCLGRWGLGGQWSWSPSFQHWCCVHSQKPLFWAVTNFLNCLVSLGSRNTLILSRAQFLRASLAEAPRKACFWADWGFCM